MTTFSFVLVVLVTFISAVVADVLHLSEAEFYQHNDKSTNLLVEFYAPWCGHCKSLAPEWEIAGDTFIEKDDIKIIAIDATQAERLSEEMGIEGFPTIKFFPKGTDVPEEYDGGRTADEIVNWVNDKIGTTRKVRTAPSAVTVLGSHNWDKVVKNSGKHALVEFYAPWCGHCKSLAPTYDELGKVFNGEKSVVIAKVDATEEGSLAEKYGVEGFPTIKWFPAGSDEPIDYESGRDLDAFVKFINENAGTQRSKDGKLLEDAGRVKALDDIINSRDRTVDGDLVAALQAAAGALSGTDREASKHYIAIAEKIVAKGAEYPAKEQKRLLNMISNPSVAAESKTSFMLKYNIIAAYIQ